MPHHFIEIVNGIFEVTGALAILVTLALIAFTLIGGWLGVWDSDPLANLPYDDSRNPWHDPDLASASAFGQQAIPQGATYAVALKGDGGLFEIPNVHEIAEDGDYGNHLAFFDATGGYLARFPQHTIISVVRKVEA